MRMPFMILAGASVLAAALPALAQEVVVTGQERSNSGWNGSDNEGLVPTGRPVIVLKRTADYAMITVRIIGDARDGTQRRADLHTTIRNAIALGAKSGIELATGSYVLTPLTLANHTELPLNGDGRPDTDQGTFLVKTRLAPGMDIKTARSKLTGFIESVPKAGRSTLSVIGGTGLSVVNPDQYRGALIDLIAADAAASAAKFGPAYGVAVSGLDRPVEWSRAGPTEIFLYLAASYTVRKD